MAIPLGNILVVIILVKTGIASVGATVTVAEVRSTLPAWAAFFTFTANVSFADILPVKVRVSVAVVSPEFTLDTCEMDKFGIADNSSKLDAVTPLAKVVPLRDRLSVALFRFVSVSEVGFVADIDTALPTTLCFDWSASAL